MDGQAILRCRTSRTDDDLKGRSDLGESRFTYQRVAVQDYPGERDLLCRWRQRDHSDFKRLEEVDKTSIVYKSPDGRKWEEYAFKDGIQARGPATGLFGISYVGDLYANTGCMTVDAVTRPLA